MTPNVALIAIKAAHTLLAALFAGLIVYALWRGVVGGDRRGTWVALAVIAGETMILIANGGRCPFSDWAAALTPPGAPVEDIFLPRALARAIPWVFGPLTAAALGLNVWRAVVRRT